MSKPAVPSGFVASIYVSGALFAGTLAKDANVWAKHINGFNVNAPGGYAVVGKWIKVGTSAIGPTIKHIRTTTRNGIALVCVQFGGHDKYRVVFLLNLGGAVNDPAYHARVRLFLRHASGGSNVTDIDISSKAPILYALHDESDADLVAKVEREYVSNPERMSTPEWRKPMVRNDTLALMAYLGTKDLRPLPRNLFIARCKNALYLGGALAAFCGVTVDKGPYIVEGTASADEAKKPKKKKRKPKYVFDVGDGQQKSVVLPDDYRYYGNANGIDLFEREASGKVTTVFNIINSLQPSNKELDKWKAALEAQLIVMENMTQTARIAVSAVKGIAQDSDKNNKK